MPIADLHDAALRTDEDGRIRDANASALGIFRRDRRGLLGRPLHDVMARADDVLASEGLMAVEGRRADGTPVRLEACARRGPDGSALVLLFETASDAVAEQASRLFGIAFDDAPIGMAILDGDGRYARVNEALCTMLGRPASQLLGRRDQGLTHPDDRARDTELVWGILNGEHDAAQVEKRFLRPDGEVVDVIANLTYVRDEAGDGVAWVGQFQDVTRRRRVEVELRRERDFSSALLGAMREGFVLTRDGVVVEVNDAFCALVQHPREELLGRGWPYPWIPQADGDAANEVRDRWRSAGGGSGEFPLRRRDGSVVDTDVSTTRAVGPGGEVLGHLSTFRDVSLRRRHERELARLAVRDPLTGLVNRRGFTDRLRDEVARAHRSGRPLSVAVLDLDHFKAVNDRHGHPVGDRVLAEVGRRFRGLTRAGEHIARTGGEEFAWILPDTDGSEAFAAAERARRIVEHEGFGAAGPLTISVGVCEMADAGSGDELYRLADQALYWAKEHGRNLVFRWTADTNARLVGDDPGAEAAERDVRLRALMGIARIVDGAHHLSTGHAERVAGLAGDLAGSLGWDGDAVARLREAGAVHDVGKVVVPQAVLHKPGRFDAAEWEQMQTHPGVGASMCEGVLDAEQCTWVRGHHERWDGSGYPDRLPGPGTAEGARILAVADCWDAMTSTRAYCRAMTPEEALAELLTGSGSHFDPTVVEAMAELHATADV